jgi:hypothetical protein
MTAVITEAQRFEMHTCLRGLMGEEVANTMMEHLPPSGWSDVVRKADLDQVEVALKSDISLVRSDLDRVEVALKSDIALVRGDLEHAQAAMKSDVEQLQKDIARVEADLKSSTTSLRSSIWSSLGITASIMLGQMALIIYKIP